MKESFQCDLCTEEFRCKTHLKKHIMLNHEELYNELYNLTCPFCNNYFNNTYVLKNHIAEVHEKVKKYQCQFCEKAFGQAGTLKRHVVSVHEKKSKIMFANFVKRIFVQKENSQNIFRDSTLTRKTTNVKFAKSFSQVLEDSNSISMKSIGNYEIINVIFVGKNLDSLQL